MDPLAIRIAARYIKKKVSDEGNPIYLYSERQIARRHKEKAERLEKLRKNVSKLREQVKKDLNAKDPKVFLSALAAGLMDHTAERVGNPESAKDGHFGVTGWKTDHISWGKGKASLKYVGKSGVKHEKDVTDASLVKALRRAYDACKDGEIFATPDVRVDSSAVNAYLKKFDVTAKDLRGLFANQVMQRELRKARKGELPKDPKERKKKLSEEFKTALEATAEAVGHEAATLKSQYLVPGLEDDFMKDGVVNEQLHKS